MHYVQIHNSFCFPFFRYNTWYFEEHDRPEDEDEADGHSSSYSYRLNAYSSEIHLLFSLTKESVSTNNLGGGNYGSPTYGTGVSTIKTVDSFEIHKIEIHK